MSFILFHVMSLQQTKELVARNGNYALIFRMTSMAVHTELSSGWGVEVGGDQGLLTTDCRRRLTFTVSVRVVMIDWLEWLAESDGPMELMDQWGWMASLRGKPIKSSAKCEIIPKSSSCLCMWPKHFDVLCCAKTLYWLFSSSCW